MLRSCRTKYLVAFLTLRCPAAFPSPSQFREIIGRITNHSVGKTRAFKLFNYSSPMRQNPNLFENDALEQTRKSGSSSKPASTFSRLRLVVKFDLVLTK